MSVTSTKSPSWTTMSGPGIDPLKVEAGMVVPASSMTIGFSTTVSVNSTIFGLAFVACSCACTNGGATSVTLSRVSSFVAFCLYLG